MNARTEDEQLLINEMKLLLAEKRTHLAIFRTGAALFALSVTALGVFLAQADPTSLLILDWSTLVIGVLLTVAVAGIWQMYHSNKKIKRLNAFIKEIEEKDKRLADIVI